MMYNFCLGLGELMLLLRTQSKPWSYLHSLILGVDWRVPQGCMEGPKHVPCASRPVKDGYAQNMSMFSLMTLLNKQLKSNQRDPYP